MSARHTLRAATFADVDAVTALLRDDPELKSRSAAGWQWLFRDNPANRGQDPLPEMGWVLERDGCIDGYLGNIQVEYLLDGRRVRAAISTCVFVRPVARADSARLISVFFRQPGADIVMSTTACEPDGALYRMYKAAVPQDESFSTSLVWVADDSAALGDICARFGIRGNTARVISVACAPLSRAARGLTGFANAPKPTGHRTPVKLEPSEIDTRFDALWQSVAAAPGLQVRRDSATLRWFFSDPDSGGAPVILAVMGADGAVAYAAAARHRMSSEDPEQLRILDLVAKPGEERAIADLFYGLLDYARAMRIGLLFCPPCGAHLGSPLRRLRPYVHTRTHPSHFLRGTQKIDTAKLVARGVWLGTGLDGDTPFAISYRTGRRPH